MKKVLLYLLLLAVGLLCGLIIGLRNSQSLLGTIYGEMTGNKANVNKIDYLLDALDRLYVDSIDVHKIDEATVAYALEQLDPHSSYIPKEDMEEVNEELNGSFSGIGVQFNIQQDTIYVVDVIKGGPSERAGIQAGDKIVMVNDTLFVGKSINNEKVFKKLRGPKGTKIRLGVRRGPHLTLFFNVIRDDIPVHTVNAAHMLTPEIGYIYITSFGQETYKETLNALAKVKRAGAKKLIVDLRGNPGGYLDAVANILNEFLKRGSLIVYMEGKSYKRGEYRANGTGSFKDMEIVVLIDEFSASASEIFAGAIQDNDRGTVIGRRSFGKGLVQQPLPFPDGSEARITVARYYTPAGRCIQKPYAKGKASDYDSEIWNRYIHGEFFNADSIKQNDSTVYKTVKGRTVYGGGGIMPDIFIARDTTEYTPSFVNLVNNTVIYRFALRYTDRHRAELKKLGNWRAIEQHLNRQDVMAELLKFAASEGVKVSQRDLAVSGKLISRQLNSYIVRNVLTEDDFYQIINQYDPTVQRAIKELNKRK